MGEARFSLRLDPVLLERIRAVAATEERSVNWVIVKALELSVGSAPARPDKVKAQRVSVDMAEADERVPAETMRVPKADCAHPHSERRLHAWGATCGLCGVKVQ